MKQTVNECIYFIFTISLIVLLPISIYGINDLVTGNLVINIRDTYFSLNTTSFFILFVPITFVILYLPRIFLKKFRSLISNLIFAIFNGLSILIFASVLFLNNEDSNEMNYRFWLLILILLFLEVLVFYKCTKIKNGIDK